MKALTVRQPLWYLAGVLHGDGWLGSSPRGCNHGYFRLRVADADFAEAAALAASAIYGREVRVALDERGYHHVRTYDSGGLLATFRRLTPGTPEERAAWLRGLFDSEGNAQCRPKPRRGPRSWDRRVAFYSTDLSMLALARFLLRSLGIDCRSISSIKPSEGHKGTRPVYELAIKGNRVNYGRFASRIGSSIKRKASALDRLPTSYVGAA